MHNLLLLISLAGNKAYSQPTVNNSDSSPSFTFAVSHSSWALRRSLFQFVLEHVGVYLELYLTKENVCAPCVILCARFFLYNLRYTKGLKH